MSPLPLPIRAPRKEFGRGPLAQPTRVPNNASPSSPVDENPDPDNPAAQPDDPKSKPLRTTLASTSDALAPSSISNTNTADAPSRTSAAAASPQEVPPSSQIAFFAPTSSEVQTTFASSTMGISTGFRLPASSSSSFSPSSTPTPSTPLDVSPTIQSFHDNPHISRFSTLIVPSASAPFTGAESTALPPGGRSSGLSTLSIGLMTLGGLCAIGLLTCVFRYLNHRKRHRLRTQRRGRGTYRGTHDTKVASTGEKENRKESPVFGGRERSGMTPLPSSNVRYSWATFPDDAGIAAATAAVVGLPVSFNSPGPYTAANHMFLPSRNYSPPKPPTSTIHLPGGYTRSSSAGSISDSEIPQAVIKTAARRSFKPPRILVTSSSPTSDAYSGFLPASDSEGSGGETEFRLVAPPKLAVVNVPGRESGCSWDDSIGVQLGVRMQRQHQPPKALNKPPALPRSPLSQRSPSGSPHVKGSPRTPGRNPGPKTQLLYDVPKLPATEPEAVKVTRLHNNTSTINERYPLASQLIDSQDQRENLLNTTCTNALRLDTPQHQRAYLPPLAIVNSGSDDRLFLDTRPSSPTLSDTEAYAPSATTASVYTTHTGQLAFRPLHGRANVSRHAYSATTTATDSVLLSPATVVGNAMLTEWDAVPGGPPAPVPAHLPLPLPVSGAYGGGVVGGVAWAQTQARTQTVPSLPPVGQPSLRQLALMHEMPNYRSPTYSIYGMYSGSATGPALDAGAGAGAGANGKRQTLLTPGSAYGGLAVMNTGVETDVGTGVGTGVSNAMGQRSGGAVPGTGLFGRIL